MGTNDLKKGGKRYTPLASKIHEQYIPPYKYDKLDKLIELLELFARGYGLYDIALLKMDKFGFSKEVQSIDFTPNFVDEGANLQITGWGSQYRVNFIFYNKKVNAMTQILYL